MDSSFITFFEMVVKESFFLLRIKKYMKTKIKTIMIAQQMKKQYQNIFYNSIFLNI